MFYGPIKLFEIANNSRSRGHQTVNAEGTGQKVRDSAMFEIAHVRDNGSRVYVHTYANAYVRI